MDRQFVNDWDIHGQDRANGRHRKHRLIIGSACWDRISIIHDEFVPGKKVPLTDYLETPGGGGVNVALGHGMLAPQTPIVLIAPSGQDEEGQKLGRALSAQGISAPWQPVAGVATGFSNIIAERSGRSSVLIHTGARSLPIPLELVQTAMAGAEAACLVAPGDNSAIAPVLRCAAEQDVPVFMGVGGMQIHDLGYEGLGKALVAPVELIICNGGEAAKLTGEQDLEVQLDALRFGGRVRTVVITDGGDGIHALHDGRPHHVAAYSDGRPFLNDLGCGDAAQGAIVDALLHGLPIDVALAAGARQGFEAGTGYGSTTNLMSGRQMRAYLSPVAVARAG